MYLERPVVSARLGSSMEVIEDGIDGILIEPGNSAMLAEQIDRILDDANFAQRLGTAAKRTVIAKFNEQHTVAEIERISATFLGVR